MNRLNVVALWLAVAGVALSMAGLIGWCWAAWWGLPLASTGGVLIAPAFVWTMLTEAVARQERRL